MPAASGIRWIRVGGCRPRSTPHDPPLALQVPNILGEIDLEHGIGRVVFNLSGEACALEAIQEDGDELFLIFADPTNHETTYPSGRFLYAEASSASLVTLDFNRAYSPPCAFTAYATCPLPPAENHLKIPVQAGEIYRAIRGRQGGPELTPPTGQPPSVLRRIFVSADEARLRTGWRLVIHGMLVLALTVPVSLFAAVVILILQVWSPKAEPLSLWIGVLASAAVFVLATWVARRVLDRRSFVSLGFGLDRHTLPDLVVGFLIPMPMLGLLFALSWWFGWTQWRGWAWESQSAAAVVLGMAGGLSVFILVGISEEVLSRGYHLQNLAEAMGLPRAWLLSSLIFAGLHVFNPGFSVQAGLGLVLAGLFLATGWLRTGRLWLSIGLHIGWNFFEGTVFGFPVSGLDLFRLMDYRIEGPAWATGGAFGPEAGAIVLPGLALGALLVWLYTRRRSRPHLR